MRYMKKKNNDLALLGQLGKRIAFWRKQKGMTQLDLSLETGLANSFISELELGKRNPSAKTLWRICEALNITLEELFRGVIPIE